MKDKEAILKRRAEMIKELTDENNIRTQTGVRAGEVMPVYPYRIICLTICLSIAPVLTPIDMV